MASSGRFKVKLANMDKNELLSLIWLYDQYIDHLEDEQFPVDIELFYGTMFQQITKN